MASPTVTADHRSDEGGRSPLQAKEEVHYRLRRKSTTS